MNLYTNHSDTNTLKILISKEINSFKLNLKIVDAETLKNKPFPLNRPNVLEIKKNEYLFTSNAICSYIFSKSKKDSYSLTANEWLEWENKNLNPLITSILQSKGEKSLKSDLYAALKHLNENLTHNSGVIQGSESLPEVALWSNIYALKTDAAHEKEFLKNFHSIKSWYEKLGGQEAFKKAVSRYQTPTEDASSDKDESKDEDNENKLEEKAAISEDKIQEAFDMFFNSKPLPLREVREGPILPESGKRNVLITSALPYVNNVPHLGNIIGSVLSADAYARYCRIRGYNTLYICGTDEYGTATETKALKEGMTPLEVCTKYNKIHKDIYDWFNISFDHFGRTSTNFQTEIAQDIFWDLHKEGYLLKQSVEQLYCESCTKFLADRFVEGICPFCNYEDARGDQCDKCGKLINAPELKEPKCKVCQHKPIVRSSEHLFLDLPKLEPKLKEWLNEATTGQWTPISKAISNAWIKDGLKPRCITRDLKWGTPVPMEGFQDKVFYVWYDAPIGYLSILAQYTKEWQQWWKQPEKVELFQFMAKDNVPFHSIIFPACLLGTGKNYTMVNHLSAIAYLNYEDEKFSKSRGIGVFGDHCKETTMPSDIWRFYLLFIRPEGQDASFSWYDLGIKINSELLGNIGNFINRGLSFIGKNFKGIVPPLDLNDDDKLLIAKINVELETYFDQMEKVKLRDAIRPILSIGKLGNLYIQTQEPWVLIKGTPEQKARAGSIMGLSSNISCLLSLLLEPYIPESVANLRKQLNFPLLATLDTKFTCLLPAGHKMGKPSPLFKKIETAEIDEWKSKFSGRPAS